MKKPLVWKIAVFTLICFLSMNLNQITAKAYNFSEVYVNIPEQVNVGKSYDMEFKVNYVEDLYGYSINFIFDPNIIEVTGVEGGDIFSSKGELAQELSKSYDNNNGSVVYNTVLTTNTEGINSGGTLMKVSFKARAQGELPINITLDPAEKLKLAPMGPFDLASTALVLLTDSNGDPIYNISAQKLMRFVQRDSSGPQVTSRNIENGATGVSTTPEIILGYDEDILPAENFNGVILQDENGNQISTNTIIEGKNLKITSKETLQNYTNYRLIVFEGTVKDEFDNRSSHYQLEFKTIAAKEDVNEDGFINIFDVAKVAKNYNLLAGDLNWIEKYDINSDEIVNLPDLMLIVKKFVVQHAVTINHIENINAFVELGSTYNFPTQVKAYMNNGTTRSVEVTWENPTVDTSSEGQFSFYGTVPGYRNKVQLSLNVKGNLQVLSFADANLENAIRNQIGKMEGKLYKEEVEALGGLNVSGYGIDSLEGIEALTNLQTLWIENNNITDLTPLSGLTSLTKLSFERNSVTNLEALRNLTNLKDLFMSQNRIVDLEPIGGLINLESLQLDGNEIVSLEPIQELIKLIHLNISGNRITDISALSKLTNLQHFYSWNNKITDITAVAGLANLKELVLEHGYINDISALRGLGNLTMLSLTGNDVSDLSPVLGMTNLKTLCLQGNEVTEINSLSGLTNLENLYLFANNISDISSLENLKQLRSLSLRDNKIVNVAPLSGLSNLEELYLSNNPINDYSQLQSIYNNLRNRDFQL